MRGTLMAIRTPVSTSLNDIKQREAACLHVPLFFSLGKPNTPTYRSSQVAVIRLLSPMAWKPVTASATVFIL